MNIKLLIERYWPLASATGVAAAWWALAIPFPDDRGTLMGTAATVASVFASFLGVAQAIIIGLNGSPAYNVLKSAGYTTILFTYLRSGILSAVTLAGLSIVGFFIRGGVIIWGVDVYLVFGIAWVWSGVLALFCFARITNILFKLLNQT